MKHTFILPGHLYTTSEPEEIATILGSCVGIALYDPIAKVGGLNHYLLPEQPEQDAPSCRYGDTAIRTLIHKLIERGAHPRNFKAQVFGGGNVVENHLTMFGIGERNIAIAHKILRAEGIPIVAEDTGGLKGRKIYFETTNFTVRKSASEASLVPAEVKLKNVKVLVVDDSATVRNLFATVFQKHGIEVVGMARDAYEARDLIVKHKPDVLTLDIEMPKMNGVDFLEKLMKFNPMPVLMVSSLSAQGSAALKSLELGALEFVHKPSQYDPQSLRHLSETLIEKIKGAVVKKTLVANKAKLLEQQGRFAKTRSESRARAQQDIRAIVIGGNAGAAKSLERMLSKLSDDCPPVLVSISTVAGFAQSFAEKLQKQCKVRLIVPKGGETLQWGCVYLAPAEKHLRVNISPSGQTICEVTSGAPIRNQRPSTEALFMSAADKLGKQALGLLMSGFGNDGLVGLEALHKVGAPTVCENPDHSEFPVLPEAAMQQGLVEECVDLESFSEFIFQLRSRKVAA